MLAAYTVGIPECNREGESDTLHSDGFRLYVSNGWCECIRDGLEDFPSSDQLLLRAAGLVELAGYGPGLGELDQQADAHPIDRICNFSRERHRYSKTVRHIGN
jgi:hypothetical protein